MAPRSEARTAPSGSSAGGPARRTQLFLARGLPAALEPLTELALDLRWTWSHASDALWRALDADAWERSANPWLVLQDAPAERLEAAASDAAFVSAVQRAVAQHRARLCAPAWFEVAHPQAALAPVAYFSMEYGLGEGLPLYAGGLGVLAGDHLKAASDLGVPLAAVGLLYQEGYFRQQVEASGEQHERYPYNDPLSLPIQPALDAGGGWLHVQLALPGRPLWLRLWRAQVGRTTLLLLDANDALNAPADRGITAKLYGDGSEVRLLQEIVLGVGGWRALEAAGVTSEVCHLNEGHAAFAAVERARRFALAHGATLGEALWATRAGNVFTTHTPVAAGFDRFPPELVRRYLPAFELEAAGATGEALLRLGRRDPGDAREPLNMAVLGLRTCARTNGVSRLHGEVSRELFQELFPRWPRTEVPIGHVTNGVHVPSWDSHLADRLWTDACGKARWLGTLSNLEEGLCAVPDAALWELRTVSRGDLVRYARFRLEQQLGQRGEGPAAAAQAAAVLDPTALTLGFARRFAEYKRPNLLLSDPARLAALLGRADRPVQLVVAGKAHPADELGKRLVAEWVRFSHRADVRARAVFLEDYDVALAQRLVAGVDVWINTPRRPWEACGTSGMKVLVNGGLNLSALDGWWAEAWTPETGWALPPGGDDAADAAALYRLLEEEVVPMFYRRGPDGVPGAWVTRMRASMARLAPRFSANRMVRDYAERVYLPAAASFRRRCADGARLARELARWAAELDARWREVRIGPVRVRSDEHGHGFEAQVECGEVPCEAIRAEVYADPEPGGAEPVRVAMTCGAALAGSAEGHLWTARVATRRPAADFTIRVVPSHPEAAVPAEAWHIAWQR
ncbi:alpha-glucan family phosphorylase [Anaeromyxobacter diazotrophicus]|uniref:Alpha-glucan phosphorylase n=1 Tax=Anaeromyxobacter diazotrophicus TaxID=2590199 RepID=A0A7I9VL54_9BACT|nr:alpha-glucan family phosphorylase [Anaeromyxobacter diazotrophicus]GEJ56918.1 alpha-glucan phosphorylase [Anaeromyxobacter diazotrophicus]